MSVFDGITSQINARRSGLTGDAFVAKSESLRVSVGRLVLTEIPNKAAGITFSSGGTTYFVNDYTLNQLPSPTTISVDWNNGVCYCDPTLENLTILCVYSGAGVVALSASRVFTAQSNGVITQTLDTIVAKASSFVSMGTYNNTTTYSIFNIVLYMGTSYICNVSTSTGNSPTNSAFWNKIAGTTYRNVYDSTVTYNNSDYVINSTSDALYVSIVDGNVGQALTNTAKWSPTISVTSMTAAESSRVTAETNRANAETTRVSNETTRGTNETNRSTAETNRASAETTRGTNESTRQSNETARIGHDTAYQLIEAYNATHSYVVLNKVTYNGSTYQCILATTNNIPTNTTYWIQIAAAGANGAGTVATITSTDASIAVVGTASTPDLSVQTGLGANKIPKRNASGDITDVLKTIDIFNDYVITGLLPPTSANLTSITTSGSAYIISQRVTKSATSNTYSATSDVYVDLDMNGNYTYITLANGAVTPAITTNSIRLFKVVTNASAITSVTDLRAIIPTAPINAFQEMFPNLTIVSFNNMTIGSFVLSRSLVTLGTIILA